MPVRLTQAPLARPLLAPATLTPAAATGVTSRIVGYAAGLVFVALAFVPGIVALLAVMPRPVMGAILIFSSSFILMNGLRIVMARMLDNRKVLVIGISLVLGLSHYVLPTLYERTPAEIAPALGSALVIGILSAVLLNLVFRIGVKRRQSLVFDPARDSFDVLYAFVERQAGPGAPDAT